MRLLKRDSVDNVSLTKDLDDTQLPHYAILSHTWGPDEDEVTFRDITNGLGVNKRGFEKIRFCVQQTKQDGLDYFWLDTCCIDKANNTELSEALISMFRWYSKAERCYVYLSDVPQNVPGPGEQDPVNSLEHQLGMSRWITRGWTLQELIAPSDLEFFSKQWQSLGSKKSLESQISDITRIPCEALRGQSLDRFSIDERLKWQEGRVTRKPEDLVYSLLGLLGVSMPVLYGEGEAQARRRLMNEINVTRNQGRLHFEMSPSPTHTVPFVRDHMFVERMEFTEMQQKLSHWGSRVALYGLGGVGKSQLAIEYSYRLRQQFPDTWVLWIHTSSAARFDQDVRKLADDVKIPGREDKNAITFQLVHNWLSDSRNRWLVILDNADDAEFLFEGPTSAGYNSTRSRIECFPVCSQGSVLVTTRHRAIARRLVDTSNLIELQPSTEHAIALLNSRLDHREDPQTVRRLAVALESIPLAIAQAAAYINNRAPRCSVKTYLAKLDKSDKSRTMLLNVSTKELRRDLEAKDSILLTWQISFEHIHATQRPAAELLSLMSFFDNQGIPETLIRAKIAKRRNREASNEDDNAGSGQGRSATDSEASSEVSVDEVFESAIVMLRDYSFISLTPDGFSFEMHRLVQLAAQIWLKNHDQYDRWARNSLQKLDTAFVRPEYEHWGSCRALYPHARRIINMDVNERDAWVCLGSILYKAAWFAWTQGLYSEAEASARQSTYILQNELGKLDPAVPRALDMLGIILENQGKYDAAEEISQQAVECSKMTLGREHPDTLSSIDHLALVLQSQAKYEAAEDMQRQALESLMRILGKEHRNTLSSMNNLAITLKRQGKYPAAEDMLRQELEASEKVLGRAHPETLISVGNLGLVLQIQGKLDAAEPLARRALEGNEKILGNEHPDTLINASTLSIVLRSQGKYADAEALSRRVVAGRRRVLGEEHPDTLLSVNEFALVLAERHGQSEAAEAMARRALETMEQVLGKEHQDTLTSTFNLAIVLHHQEKYTEAEELYRRALKGMENLMGKEHPNTLDAMRSLMRLMQSLGRDEEAGSLFQSYLARQS